ADVSLANPVSPTIDPTAVQRSPGEPHVVATLTTHELIGHANSVGFCLRPAATTEDHAPLYLWATPRGEVVYIGKAASEARLRNEGRWRDWNPHGDHIVIGLVHLLRRNNAVAQPILIERRHGRDDGFDPTPALNETQTWTGVLVERLRDRIE